jgi:hypothetical protein
MNGSMKAVAGFVLAVLLPGVEAEAKKGLELKYSPAKVGALARPRERPLAIVVKDERADKRYLAAGSMGFGVEKGGGSLMVVLPRKPDGVAEIFGAAAREAAEAFGARIGEGGDVLTLTIRDLRIDTYAFPWGVPNYVSYGRLDTTLRSPDGREASRSFRVTTFDHTARQGQIEWIYARVAWEATAGGLGGEVGHALDEDAIRKLCAGISNDEEDDLARANRVFFLGLLGRPLPVVTETLVALVKSDKRARVYQAAVGALGMLGVSEARGTLLAILTGETPLKEWDLKDTERVWHLVRALYLLKTPELAAKVPTTERMPEKLTDLLRYLETGEMPRRPDVQAEKLEKYLKKHAD